MSPARKTTSANPAYPDAHPTAPGGMSEKALIEELIDRHGWTLADAGNLNWPAKIDAVIEQRLLREQEADDYDHNMVAHSETSMGTVFEGTVDEFYDFTDLDARVAGATDSTEPDDDSDLDPEALMAELATEREGAEAEPVQYGLLTKLPDVLDYIFDGHMGAGPSASERWMECTASLGASRAFLETLTPNQQEQWATANIAARQGTTAHAAAEVEALVILGRMDQAEADTTLLELAIEPPDGEEFDDEMEEFIVEYVDLVKTYAQDRGDDHVLIEARVSAAVPLTGNHDGEVYEINGSGDCVVLPTKADPTLVVSDLKYGNGIYVEVDQNPQVRIYALGALGLLVNDEGELITDVTDVTYHIVQPRLGGIKTWSEPLGDLLTWRDEVLAPALTAALYGEAEGATFSPTENACQFCPARGGCPALTEQRVAQAGDLFDVIVEAEYEGGPGAFPETGSLDDAALGKLLTQITGLIDIHKDLKAEAERRLFRGTAVPGFQLVNYQPPRKWKDEAVEELDERPELWVSKLISPTAAEKVLGDEYSAVEALVDKPDRRPVVAREGDRRKTWEGRPPEAMFDDESGAE